MFSRNRDDTTRAEPGRGIILPVHSVLAVRLPGSARQDFFKGTSPQPIGRRRGINISGVDFWHAVEFSRNGRFLCTHPLGLSSGRFPSVFPTLPDPFSVPFPVGIHFRWPLEGLCLFDCLPALFRRVRLYQKFLTGLTGHSVLNNREVLLGIVFTRS